MEYYLPGGYCLATSKAWDPCTCLCIEIVNEVTEHKFRDIIKIFLNPFEILKMTSAADSLDSGKIKISEPNRQLFKILKKNYFDCLRFVVYKWIEIMS